MKSRRFRAILLVLLALGPAVVPGVSAAHEASGPPVSPPRAPPVQTGDATIDQALADLYALQRDRVLDVEDALANGNAAPADAIPVDAARVFSDGVDPGTRIGGVGPWLDHGTWRRARGAGVGGSVGWTMVDENGTYGAFDTLLVSPAIDLSAYVLQVCNYPFVCGDPSTTFSRECQALVEPSNVAEGIANVQPGTLQVEGACLRVGRETSEVRSFEDQVNLVVRHRYNFPLGQDGGQVLLFVDVPPGTTGATPRRLEPIEGFGETSEVFALDREPGFTGARDWSVAAFDLTRWAGRLVWLAFRVATDETAEADPKYFGPANFDPDLPVGWQLDDIEIRAPAYGQNLKVFAVELEGPSVVEGPGPLAIPRSTPATARAVILNAAAASRPAQATIRIEGLDEGIRVERFHARLAPGETWEPSLTFDSPSLANATIRVIVEATNPGPDNLTAMPDPTPFDNVANETYVARDVHRVALKVEVSEDIVDYDARSLASANLVNTGNGNLTGVLSIVEHWNGIDRTVASEVVTMAPGERAAIAGLPSTVERGLHALTARFVSPAFGPVTDRVTYVVHGSPPPVFADVDGVPDEGWEVTMADFPIPDESGMWIARGSKTTDHSAVLRARPTAEAVARGTSATFVNLRLEARYLNHNLDLPSRVEILYNRQIAADTGVLRTAPRAVWSAEFPLAEGNHSKSLSQELGLTWRRASMQILPQAADGYGDLWSLQGLEVNVIAFPKSFDANSNFMNFSGFFLDDLRITGVPTGRDEAHRIDLVRIRGDEPYLHTWGLGATPSGSIPDASVSEPTVAPSQASYCGHSETIAVGPFGLTTAQSVHANCWRPLSRDEALVHAKPPEWKNGVAFEGGRALWSWDNRNALTFRSMRLVSPIVPLPDTRDPVLLVEHAYSFMSGPDDGEETTYLIRRLGFVEVQHRLPDGVWSDFTRIEPVGGYPHVLSVSGNGETRRRGDNALTFVGGEGFYHPPPCAQGGCQAPGYINNHGTEPVNPTRTLVNYLPSPHFERSRFELEGLGLSGKEVRFAFHIARDVVFQSTDLGSYEEWTIGNVRVLPTGRPGLDAAVNALTLETAYDWRALGLGPGTKVPLNATVENRGRFAERFVLDLRLSRLNGATLASESVDLGTLAPGERRSVLETFDVPASMTETRVSFEASVRPESEAIGPDDDPENDVARIGDEGELSVRRFADATVAASLFPPVGRERLARHLPIVVTNGGNVPLEGLRVTRTIAMGATVVEERAWTILDRVEPDPRGVPLTRLTTSPSRIPEDDFFTPGIQGRFSVTVIVQMPLGVDDDSGNDAFKGHIVAIPALHADDFDADHAWTTNDASVWASGDGFRSPSALVAANRTGGLLEAWTDATVESPWIDLATAKTAVINLYTKHQLEEAYDGGRVEVTTDGISWHPIPSVDAVGRLTTDNAIVVGSSPLSTNGLATDAITGDSRTTPAHLDGWRPASYALASVAGFSSTASFGRYDAPSPGPEPIVSIDGALSAPWMVEDAVDPWGRWEIRNETESVTATSGHFWWSGPAPASGTVERRLSRTIQGTELAVVRPGDRIEVDWWDWRPGTVGTSWTGIGGTAAIRMRQEPQHSLPLEHFSGASIEVVGTRGPWNKLSASIPVDRVVNTTWLAIELVFVGKPVTVTDLGWAVENFTASVVRVVNGTRSVVLNLTLEDEDVGGWSSSGWTRVTRIEPRPATWQVAPLAGLDGLVAPRWRAGLVANMDHRLVTPVRDLAGVGGARPTLTLVHAYAFPFEESTLGAGDPSWTGKRYAGGVVEVSVFNRSRGAWDPWRQLFADAEGPDETRQVRRVVEPRAAPYPKSLFESGDTFERWPRVDYPWYAPIPPLPNYVAAIPGNVSFAFSGNSNGYVTDRFDLSPFAGERVRFAFHVFSNPITAAQAATGHWTIDSAALEGRVLEVDRAKLRLRLATDASGLDGSWSVDELEVSGMSYVQSVGIHLESTPTVVSSGGNVTLAGHVRNHGPGPREIFLGLRSRATAPLKTPTVTEGLTWPASGPWQSVAGPFQLAPAGATGSRASFGFLAFPGPRGTEHRVTLEILEMDASGRLVPAADDVPSRAARAWLLKVVDATAAAINVTVNPSALAEPGSVNATVLVRNEATLPFNATIRFDVLAASGEVVHTRLVAGPILAQGGSVSLSVGGVALGAAGNYTLRVTLPAVAGASGAVALRVGRSDVALLSDFENGFGGWLATSGFRWTSDDAARGEASVLFGVNASEYAAGMRAETRIPRSGSITSPPLDLRVGAAFATVAFWYKIRFASGTFALERGVAPHAEAPCTNFAEIPLDEDVTTTGSRPGWSHATVSLPPSNAFTCLRFSVSNADDAGFRLDAVHVVSAVPSIEPVSSSYPIEDNARKVYPFLVTNRGSAPAVFKLEVEERLSRLTSSQTRWMTFEPRERAIGPGETARLDLVVETPASRGAFPQSLEIAVAARNAEAPEAFALAHLALEFAPRPRADVAAVVSIDGRAVRAGSPPVEVEEAVPHEIGVVLSNLGLETSAPVDVELRLVEDRTGREVWRTSSAIERMRPTSSSGDSEVVSSRWKPAFGARGLHTLFVVVDPARRVADYDRSNDALAIPLDVILLKRPDLHVPRANLTIRTVSGDVLHETVPGRLVRIEGLVTNHGPTAASAVTVRLVAGSTVLKEEFVGSLGPGETHAIRTNQFAPSSTTIYRVLAFTPDVEIFSDNNEATLELPVYPDEIRIALAEGSRVEVDAGSAVTRSILLENRAPLPVVLDLSVSGASFAALARENPRIALAPAATVEVGLILEPGPREAPGERLLVLRASVGGETKAQRTIPVDVPPFESASLLIHQARGPPQAVAIEVDVANEGNVPLHGEIVLLGEAGTSLARAPVADLAPGRSALVHLQAAVDAATPPGPHVGRLVLVASANVTEREFRLSVEPSGRAEIATSVLNRSADRLQVLLAVSYSGNAPDRRIPALLGLPNGATARFDRPILDLEHGQVLPVSVVIEFPAGTVPGRYALRPALLDPSGIRVRLATEAPSIDVDLRSPRLEIVESRRSVQEPESGESTTWTVRVRNTGAGAASGTPLDLYVDGVLVDRATISDLAPGRAVDVKLSWRAEAGRHAVVVAIDPQGPRSRDHPAVAESIEVSPNAAEAALSAARSVPFDSLASLAIVAIAATLSRGLRRRDAS